MNWKARFRGLLCGLGLHEWGPWQKTQIHHLGEYPWELWQHICLADQRVCHSCHKGSRLKKKCQQVVEVLPDQK